MKEERKDLDFSAREKGQEEEKSRFVLERKEEKHRETERESEHYLLK